MNSSNKPKIAINGFGRIGRQIFRINIERGYPLEIVAINNLGECKTGAHLLKYDSSYGTLSNSITASEDGKFLNVDGHKTAYLQIREPENLPWKEMGVDIVIECTGAFTDRVGASKHLTAGAKKVLISAPGKEVDITLVMGVNENQYDPKNHNLISNASCTTNCMAPLTKVLHENFGIKYGLMTTVHAFTNDQRLQDLDHKDLRRARAAGQSIIPTTTGAAKTVGEVIPELKGKLNGHSIRVPVSVVSILDFTFISEKETTVEEVNKKLEEAANTYMKGIIAISDKPLVSIDYKKDEHSTIIDGLSTLVMENNMVKVLAWYDNEWGYSVRTVEMAKMIADKLNS